MRRNVSLLVLVLLAACSKEEPRRSEMSADQSEAVEPIALKRAYDVASEAAGPNVSPTAAPGVAFNYRYAFRLPAKSIATVQEEHAKACEQLGISRCRISGMRYRLVNEDDIEAMLAFKLDPAIARQFGKSGIETVSRAEGMLVDSEISGVDAGAAIKVADRNAGELGEDLRKVEEQLARPGLKSEERRELQSQAEQLRQSLRAIRANKEEQQESLATTPMEFRYGSGDLVPGFDPRSPLTAAFEQAGDNIIRGIAVICLVLLSLLPWALVAAAGFWLFRRLLRRYGKRVSYPSEDGPPATESA